MHLQTIDSVLSLRFSVLLRSFPVQIELLGPDADAPRQKALYLLWQEGPADASLAAAQGCGRKAEG